MAQKKLSLAARQSLASQALLSIYNEVAALLQSDPDTTAAVACALPVLDYYFPKLKQCWSWLEQADDEWFRQKLAAVRAVYDRRHSPIILLTKELQFAFGPENSVLLWHLYELLLTAIANTNRRATGTFYTPPSIARYLVQQADSRLRADLGLGGGLFDPDLPGRILEPACGSGVFLSAVLKHCRAQPTWNETTAGNLLQRLTGCDLSLVPLLLSRLRIAVLLHTSGIRPAPDFPQPKLWCGNALAGPEALPLLGEPIAVVLGNPPFSYLSQNDCLWMQSLIRGDRDNAGYFEIDGEQLGEKKTWLHDDYVKFLRLSQWCIEQNGRGVVSLVTNHGWLDNATFRIARQQLLRTFSRIDVVDLHGNAKRHEASPSSERDENVFGIAQGIALVTLTKGERRGVGPPCPLVSQVSRSDLWGSCDAKLEQLSQAAAEGKSLPHQSLVPQAPWFTFAEQPVEIPREYQTAPLLTELMPVNSTVPVTARDYFVVAPTREELQERLAEFCDPKISDDEIRRKYFQRTRSNRYEPGDTRGWKLPAARRTLMNEADPTSCIRRCLYRPFVWRFVLWHPALIDWPRTEFTRHFEHGNLALLARRQSIAGREANFFWIADCLPLDGVIRSDNRGSESFFPLCLNTAGRDARPQLNFDSKFCGEFDPAKMLSYIYGLFHSPTYRTRYAAALGMEFPRVLLPRDQSLFAALSRMGQQLIDLHLSNPCTVNSSPNLQSEICHLQPEIEDFHVGTYNVCRKWLQMQQQDRESPAFAGLQQLICYTLQLLEQIEEAIASAGGFPHAFVGVPPLGGDLPVE